MNKPRIPTPRTDALADRFGNIDPMNDPYWTALDLATELEKELAMRTPAEIGRDIKAALNGLPGPGVRFSRDDIERHLIMLDVLLDAHAKPTQTPKHLMPTENAFVCITEKTRDWLRAALNGIPATHSEGPK